VNDDAWDASDPAPECNGLSSNAWINAVLPAGPAGPVPSRNWDGVARTASDTRIACALPGPDGSPPRFPLLLRFAGLSALVCWLAARREFGSDGESDGNASF